MEMIEQRDDEIPQKGHAIHIGDKSLEKLVREIAALRHRVDRLTQDKVDLTMKLADQLPAK
jgi:hypothetical protein